MARAVKCRRVCQMPSVCTFSPNGSENREDGLILTVEELEAIRLCDLEGLEQDEAAKMMDVSRGTFQRILYAARKTVAAALCGGRSLSINGGNYELAQSCGRKGSECCAGCRRRNQRPEHEF